MSPEILCCLVLITALAVMISGNEPNSLRQALQRNKNINSNPQSSVQNPKKQKQPDKLKHSQAVSGTRSGKVTMLFKAASFLLLVSLSKLVWSKSTCCMLVS